MRGRVAFVTLGCKLNSYETESLRGVFYHHQYDVVNADEAADYYVINTCAVTGQAESDARQFIRHITKRNASARVIVTGCYAQRDAQTLAAMPEVALVVGNAEKTHSSTCSRVPFVPLMLGRRCLPRALQSSADGTIRLWCWRRHGQRQPLYPCHH